jgi:hypothetical protein
VAGRQAGYTERVEEGLTMNQNASNGSPGGPIPWLSKLYFENQQKFPVQELKKYAGKYVAFSWEGDKILANGASEAEVRAQLVAAGLDPQRVVYSYVDDL